MAFDFSKLRGRIKEQFGSEKAFADAMGIAQGRLSARLNNKTKFDSEEMVVAAQLLNIPDEEFGTYFFKLKFEKSNI